MRTLLLRKAPTVVAFAIFVLFSLLSLATVVDAVFFEFLYLDNEQGVFERRGWLDEDSLFQRNMRAAGELWGAEIDSTESLLVSVQPTTVTGAGARFFLGRRVGVDGEGNDVVEPSARRAILTGFSPDSAVDIEMVLDVTFVDQWLWFDPTPLDRTDERVPFGKVDFVGVVLHELGHGLGMSGYRSVGGGDSLYGSLSGVATIFDSLSYFDSPNAVSEFAGGNLRTPIFFHGPVTMAVNCGRPVPLSHFSEGHELEPQNFYHFGNQCDGGEESNNSVVSASLMSGCHSPTDGSRLAITDLDRALLSDLGYPLKSTVLRVDCDAGDAAESALTSQLCPAEPRSTCSAASESKLKIRHSPKSGKRSLKFRFTGKEKSAPVYGLSLKKSASVFGLPTVGTDYALCIYNEDSQLVQEISIPSGTSHWKGEPDMGLFDYKNNNNDNKAELMKRVHLQAGRSILQTRVVQIAVDSRKSADILSDWTMPREENGMTPLLSLQVVHNVPYSDTCFGVTFDSAALKKNSARQFVAEIKS